MFGRDADHLIPQLGESTLPKIHTAVLLLSCQPMNDRREACRETFLNHGIPEGMVVCFLVGRPNQATTLSGDIMYVDCPDSYLALPQKTLAGIREALIRWNPEWVYKGDDDTFVNLPRLKNYLKSRDFIGRPTGRHGMWDTLWHAKKCAYGLPEISRERQMVESSIRHYAAVDQTPFVAPWANGGVGYLLSNRAARLVAREPLAHAKAEVYEDKFVGDVMASYGIYLHGSHKAFRGLPVDKKGHVTNFSNMMGATTLHPLLPPDMRNCYWKALRAGELHT
jgi:hypothetical protein